MVLWQALESAESRWILLTSDWSVAFRVCCLGSKDVQKHHEM